MASTNECTLLKGDRKVKIIWNGVGSSFWDEEVMMDKGHNGSTSKLEKTC